MSNRSFFFFSSRRRHTRSKRDWSSDVCSSDLKARNERSPRRFRQMYVDLEVALKSDAHDFEIAFEKRYLLLDWNLIVAAAAEAVTQELAQPGDHAAHTFRVALYERRNRVQCVEKKMRIKLGVERAESRLGELGLELCGLALQSERLALARSEAKEVVARDSRREHSRVEHKVIQNHRAKQEIHRTHPWRVPTAAASGFPEVGSRLESAHEP